MKIRLIPVLLALTAAGVAQAAYSPIALTSGSYNADVVVEKTATPPLLPGSFTTASMDNGTANTGDTWVEAGFFTNTAPVPGLPAAGSTITSASFSDHLYTFAPSYKANNAILLDASPFTNVYTFAFTTPAACQALSFLTSGGNGGCTYQWTAHHADGTTETGTTNSADWFNGDNPAYTSQGRVNAQSFSLDNYNSGNPRLYSKDVAVTNTASPVTAVDLQYVTSSSGAHTCIMAVSGQAPGGGNFNPIAVTGYNADIVVEASARVSSYPFKTFTTASMDGGTNNTGNTWYEQGYVAAFPLTGLPPAGSLLVSTNQPDHTYQMAPSYTAPNAIYADSNNPLAQITFALPDPYSALSFLSSDANGAITVGVVLIHQDGTLETNVFNSQDWFNATPAAFTANGRVNLNWGAVNNLNSGNPRLYEAQFPLANTTSPVTGAYLAWTTNNAPSVNSRLVVLAVSGVRAGYYPLALTPGSYNADVVVEKAATPPVAAGGFTTASMDGGTGNNGDTWSEVGLFASDPSVGLPAAGSTITSASFPDHLFQFAPSYKANNTIMLDASSFSGLYTWTLASPAPYAQLSFLTSGGNGGCVFQWTAHHADGTTETGAQPSADWFSGANPAFTANVRANAQSFTRDNYMSGNPRLYGKDVTLNNTSSAVTSIDLQYVSSAGGAHTCIMAVSGQAPGGGNFNPITVTGYNADIVVEASIGPITDAGGLSSAPLTQFTTATMDAGTNNTGATWYEQGYVAAFPLTGLPPAGSILTSTNLPDHSYQLAPDYTLPNAIYADSNNPVAQVSFANPTPFSALSFLSSDGNGAITVGVVVIHQDGTMETNYFNSQDWFNGVPAAFTSNGRINLDNGVIDVLNAGNPRLYEAQFPLTDTTSPVTGAILLWTTNNNPDINSRFVVLAVSGTAGAVAPIITVQPVSVTVSAGANASFTVGVVGTGPFTYQWQAAGATGVYTNLTDGGVVSGSSTATLSLNAVTTDSSGVSFRAVISNASGSVNSGVAILTVYSTLANQATPGDTIVNYPSSTTSPGAEGVVHAIDGNTQKWLNFGLNGGSPYLGPAGCVWTPLNGSTIISGIRIFTANDATERDPANFILEGSNDGGSHYSLIASNLISLPDTRNAAGAAIDMTTQAFGEVDFHNTTAYTVYRLTFTLVKNNAGANSFQLGEVQFLGIVNPSPAPIFTQQPQSIKVYNRTAGSFNASATGSPTYSWARGTNGVYALLADGGNLSGSQTTALTVNPASYADAADYVCIAQNTYGATTSSLATLTIVSLLTNVALPSDPILTFGDYATNDTGAFLYADDVGLNLIDGTTIRWRNGGSGFSTSAGFPPFAGPVGAVLTNESADLTGTFRPTLVVGLRIFTADGNSERDPADYTLEGSLNGTTFHGIAAGALSLPLDRNTVAGYLIDPLTMAEEEIFFVNHNAYPIYRLTFNHTRSDNSANSLQVAEVEFLGVDASVAVPAVTLARGTTPGTITITSSLPAELYSTTDLAGGKWVDEGPITGSVTITPNPATPKKYYRVGVY